MTPASPDRNKKQAFTLHPVILVIVLLVAGLVVAGGMMGRGAPADPEQQIPTAIGGAIGAMLVLLIPGFLAFYICRRSVRAANITTSVILGLWFMGAARGVISAVTGPSAARAAQADAIVHRIQRETDQSVRDQIKGGASGEAITQTVKKAAAELQFASRAASKDTARAVQVCASFWSRAAELNEAYLRANDAFVKSGGLAVGGVSAEDLDERMRLVGDARRTNQSVMDYFRDAPGAMVAELRSQGMGEEGVATFAQGVDRNTAVLKAGMRSRACEETVLACALDQFAILRRYFGDWTMSEGSVMFAEAVPEATITRYNDLAASLDQSAAEQQEALREMARLQDARMKTAGEQE